MARTVSDAVICLGTMVGVDEKDSKTNDNVGNSSADYTSFLNADGLKGKGIGHYTKYAGSNFKID